MTVNITADTGPTAGASSVTFTEDHTYTFKATDFVYSDSADASTDPLASITIVTLPSSGTLKLGINNVTAGQVITAASIPNLTYVPNTDVAGAAAATFQFKVTDTATGGTPITSAAATMTVNITADTGPSALASSINATENTTYTFKTSDFGYSDSGDATTDPMASVIITTLPGDGTLYHNGTALTPANPGT